MLMIKSCNFEGKEMCAESMLFFKSGAILISPAGVNIAAMYFNGKNLIVDSGKLIIEFEKIDEAGK